MEDFLNKLAEILEVDQVKASDQLTAFPEWDSLSVLSAISMILFDYRVTLTAAELRAVPTAEALYNLVILKSTK
jgi:acyl carrier protein